MESNQGTFDTPLIVTSFFMLRVWLSSPLTSTCFLRRCSQVMASHVNTYSDLRRNTKLCLCNIWLSLYQRPPSCAQIYSWNICFLSLIHEVCWNKWSATYKRKSNLCSFHIGFNFVSPATLSYSLRCTLFLLPWSDLTPYFLYLTI